MSATASLTLFEACRLSFTAKLIVRLVSPAPPVGSDAVDEKVT